MKTKKYWLRVGIIFSIVGFLASVLVVLLGNVQGYLLLLPFLPIVLPGNFIINIISPILVSFIGSDVQLPSWIIIISTTIFWFVAGVIMGWIYGKIKK